MSIPNKSLSIVSSIAFIALFAQLSIDVPLGQTMIPITGQTFAVLLVGYWLGTKWGMIAIVGYIALGIIGFPIFADAKSGWEVVIGGSGGYLIGFIVGAGIAGWFYNRKPIFVNALLAMMIGTLVILLFGVGRLAQLYGLEKGLDYGFYPFWQGAIVKIILGTIAAWAVNKFSPNKNMK